jgi:nucleotide-binding universal stress UspA family protein
MGHHPSGDLMATNKHTEPVMAVGINRILCATDFSEFSGGILDYGIKLTRRFNARLYIFHAVHFAKDGLYSTDVLERREKQQRLSRMASEKIDISMSGAGIEWEPVISCGEPVEEINRVTTEKRVDMVIAASHGLSGFKRFLLGTVVEKLARTLTLPLLTILSSGNARNDKCRSSGEIRHILVGCNFWSETDPVLSFATYFADRLNANLHLLHAIEAPLNEDLVDPTKGPYEKVQNELQNHLHRRLEQTINPEVKERLKINTVVTAGLPGEALALHAETSGADLIIVGVKRRNILEKLIIGSTTESIIRHAPCPVLTIPYHELKGTRKDRQNH